MSVAALHPSLKFRILLEADAKDAFAVHCSAADQLTNHVVRRESLEFITDQVNYEFMIGAFPESGGLVAYGGLVVSARGGGKIADALDLDPESRLRFCLLDGVAIHPDWQQRGIHGELITKRLCYARDLGKNLVGVTVSPRNTRSLKNLLDAGFRIRRAEYLYGGYERLILMRDLICEAQSYAGIRSVLAEDFVQNLAAIREGLSGFKLFWNEENKAMIHYGR